MPLSAGQHVVSILIGATCLVWNLLIKLFLPESLMNNFQLFREERHDDFINVDSIFERWKEQPASERRKSKMAGSRSQRSSDKK